MMSSRLTRVQRAAAAAKRFLVTGAGVAILAVPINVSAQAPPLTLTGESLAAGEFATPPGAGSITVTSASCDLSPTGTSSFSYQVSGVATGPYPGTFTETGTVTMGPQVFGGGFSNPSGLLQSWTASFTINSAAGLVTGNKSLPPGQTGVGICAPSNVPLPFAEQHSANARFPGLAYRAVITVAGAQFADSGTSPTTFNETPTTPVANNFNEDFGSSQVTPTPLCNQDSQANQPQPVNNQGCVNP